MLFVQTIMFLIFSLFMVWIWYSSFPSANLNPPFFLRCLCYSYLLELVTIHCYFDVTSNTRIWWQQWCLQNDIPVSVVLLYNGSHSHTPHIPFPLLTALKIIDAYQICHSRQPGYNQEDQSRQMVGMNPGSVGSLEKKASTSSFLLNSHTHAHV